jgi:hypothetical protein
MEVVASLGPGKPALGVGTSIGEPRGAERHERSSALDRRVAP